MKTAWESRTKKCLVDFEILKIDQNVEMTTRIVPSGMLFLKTSMDLDRKNGHIAKLELSNALRNYDYSVFKK